MVKTKITVSIEKPVVDNAKLALLKKGKTMSDYIERTLRALSTSSPVTYLQFKLSSSHISLSISEVESALSVLSM